MGTPSRFPDDGTYNAERDITRLQESERFMQSQGQGDFIPLDYYPTKSSWPLTDMITEELSLPVMTETEGL